MLKKKLLRDLWKNKTQFLSIFLMAFLGLLIFCGMDTESAGLIRSFEGYYEKQNLADLFVYRTNLNLTEEHQMEAIPGVEEVERRLVLEGNAKFSDDPKMTLLFLDEQKISASYLVEGENFEPGAGGIWLDAQFAKVRGIQPGDVMTLEFAGREITEQVRGTILHPEFVYYVEDSGSLMPEYGKYGFAVLSLSACPDLVCNQMVVTVSDSEDVEQVKKKIEDSFCEDGTVVGDRKSNTGYVTAQAEYEQHRMMAYMFPTVFLCIAVLGIITTMSRMTSNQRTVIGTLKALGFSKRRITLHYVSFGFWVSLCGSLLGAYVGYMWLPEYMDSMMKEYYIIPEYVKVMSNNSYIAVAMSVFVAALVSFLSCRKELRECPAVTLKPKAPGSQKSSFLESSPLWKHMAFSSRWNWRDIMRNRVRSVMGIVGVAGCCMLLVCAFGCNDSMRDMGSWMYGELISCRNRILFEEGTSYGDVFEYKKEYAGQMIQETAVEFLKPDGNKKTAILTVYDKGGYVHYQNSALQEVRLSDGEIAISYKMARILSAKPGEIVTWRPVGEEKWQTFRVGTIYRVPSGQGIAMTRNTYEALQFDFAPTAVLTNRSVPASVTDDEEVTGVQSMAEMRAGMDQNMEAMNQLIGILMVAAVLLGVVVLYNLGVLSYVEKNKEIATLKVLGFQTGKVRMILQKQNIWLTSAGILAGLPVGWWFLQTICDTLSDEQDLVAVIKLPSYGMAIFGTFLVSVLVNFILSKRVKNIDMVEALKAE